MENILPYVIDSIQANETVPKLVYHSCRESSID